MEKVDESLPLEKALQQRLRPFDAAGAGGEDARRKIRNPGIAESIDAIADHAFIAQ